MSPAWAHRVITAAGVLPILGRPGQPSFEPKIIAKRQRRLTGVDGMVISPSARGLTHGEISAYLAEVYGAEVSRQTITTITVYGFRTIHGHEDRTRTAQITGHVLPAA